jgi:hypothetical protein
MKSLFKFVVLILFSLVAFLNFVSGFGVSIPYSVQDPLRLSSGQNTEVVVGLQSSIDEGDLIIVPEIITGKEIVEIIDSSKEYNVISNQPIGAEVHLKISIPENKDAEKEYLIKLVFRDTTKKEGGMVGFSASIGASFNVLVVDKLEQPELEPPEPEQPELEEIKETKGTWVLLIFGFLLLIVIVSIVLIIWIMMRKRKNNLEQIGEIESKYSGS